jgi:hypothetical protein
MQKPASVLLQPPDHIKMMQAVGVLVDIYLVGENRYKALFAFYCARLTIRYFRRAESPTVQYLKSGDLRLGIGRFSQKPVFLLFFNCEAPKLGF